MKRLIIILAVVWLLVLLPSVSAMTFDNVKVYNEQERKVTIRDTLLIGGGSLVDVELIDNTYFCNYECSATWNVTIYQDDDDFLSNINFKKIKGNRGIQGYKFEYVSGYEEVTVEDYEQQCGTTKQGLDYCKDEVVGSHKEQVPIYSEFNPSRKLPPGNYIIKLTGYKNWADIIDWIPTFYGREVSEWAWWSSTSPSTVWEFNEANFSSVSNMSLADSLGIKNLSARSMGASMITGKIGRALSLNNSINFVSANTTGSSRFAFDTGNFTIAFWYNSSSPTIGYHAVEVNQAPTGWAIDQKADGTLVFTQNNGDAGTTNKSVSNGTWQRIVITREGTGANKLRFWVNGTNVNNATLSANISNATEPLEFHANGASIMWDDFQIYKGYAWTSAEVTYDWNNGTGREANTTDLSGANSLIAPTTALVTSNVTLSFSASHLATNGNLSNTTLYVWNSTGIFKTNFTTINGTTNQTTLNISNISLGSYQWNYLTCAVNATATRCGMTEANRTFTILGFTINSYNFSYDMNETQRANFNLNISTIPSILSINAKLSYNNTNYTSTTSCVSASGLCSISNSIDIPLVDGNLLEQNKTFFWSIAAFDGTSSTTSVTPTYGQNVSKIFLQLCDGTITQKTLNFTAYEEQNLTRLNPYSFVGTFNYWLGGGNVKRTNNFTNNNAAEISLCMKPIPNMYADAIISYNNATGSSYTARNYYLQNDTITNNNQAIPLYLLPSASSTTFILKVQDNNLLPIANVLIDIQRYYPGTDTYQTVQIARTDDAGSTVGFFQTETVDYRFILSLNNETLLTTSKQKIIPETTPYTLTFTIGDTSGSPWDGFQNITNLTTLLTFNKTNSVVTFVYNDLSDLFEQGRLLVTYNNPSGQNSTVVCNQASAQSSAILTCDLSVKGNVSYIATGYITRSGNEAVTNVISFVITSFTFVAGNLGLLLGFFIILISAFMFKFNEIAGIWLTICAIIFVNFIGLIDFGILAITAIIAVGIILTVQIER